MPLYEYYCSGCASEYELVRSAAQADDGPCPVCDQPGKRQVSTFSFKSNTFTAPKLKHSNAKPLRSHDTGRH